ncbi:gliding motility protein RemB [Mucilaginibacter myungsuensis]|uniref:Gliding motility protein RemB n=1 Tax=Mucilaginibacter myungsuensis TaxID=649104 RepID=A0A929KVR3_9SPHI|nr:gliding motility protein RemB [Mucilaginibacter myungsuensis]MBE9661345.1 gliding motility protein RemB [Mucilaginibacter myungsuensis]MDN3597488.1 gliding motility protein RemB [Mucilaginibacter myungsuensis]
MKKTFILLTAMLCSAVIVKAQSEYMPYGYQFYQKFNKDLYSTKSRIHSTIKPFIVDSLLQPTYDSLMNINVKDDGVKRSWAYRKVFQEHLIDVKDPEYTFFFDVMSDLTIGRDFSRKEKTSYNTRGYQLGGTIGKKFYFYSTGYENQATQPYYLNEYTKQTGIVSGQAYDRSFGQRKVDWSYVTATISYTPAKFLNISLGQDKTFIGDGYRSVLLSDFSSPYTNLKLTGTLGNVRYMAMYGLMQDARIPKFTYADGNRRKWATFHYLDWNVSNRLSVGFFDSIVWGDKDESGNKRGFDFTYASPIIFLRPVEASNGSPDNAAIGLTGKYKLTNGITLYGQFMLDEFEAKNFFSSSGSSRNKYGWQIGARGADLFKVRGLNYLFEYNGAKPYTYSSVRPLISYSNQTEPLAHPFGANFKELVGILNYSYKRFDLMGQVNYGHYGLDPKGSALNYGKDFLLPYTAPVSLTGNYIGQGVTTDMYYAEGRVAYVLNPKYNLRFEVGGIYRKETNSVFTNNTSMITIGLRTAFHSVYTDLASYRIQ